VEIIAREQGSVSSLETYQQITHISLMHWFEMKMKPYKMFMIFNQKFRREEGRQEFST
jgi:hypothetical protein